MPGRRKRVQYDMKPTTLWVDEEEQVYTSWDVLKRKEVTNGLRLWQGGKEVWARREIVCWENWVPIGAVVGVDRKKRSRERRERRERKAGEAKVGARGLGLENENEQDAQAGALDVLDVRGEKELDRCTDDGECN